MDPQATLLDDAVVAAFRAGDEAALKHLYDATSRLVFSFCRKSLGPDVAADVTQEIYVAAWKSRARFDPGSGTLTGWLMGIARFKTIDAIRAASRRPQLDDGEPEEIGVAAEAVEGTAQRMLMAEALAELPERQRTMVEMAFFADLTHSEIADKTGTPLGTVKSDIRRGLARLRQHMEGFDAGQS